MSGGYEVLALKEDDVQKFLAAQVHIGDPNVDYQMAQYVYKVRQDGELLEFNATHVMSKQFQWFVTRSGSFNPPYWL